MAIQQPIKQSIFPDLPRESPAVDNDGNFTSLWQLGFSSLFQALQKNFKNEGILFPPLTADNMATIQSLYAGYVGGSYNNLTMNLPDISGQTIFDSTTYISNQFIIAQDISGNVILAEWVPFAMMLTSTRNPNYVVGPPIIPAIAGVLSWMCYDIVNKVLYVCTQSGSTGVVPPSPATPLSPAVWTPV